MVEVRQPRWRHMAAAGDGRASACVAALSGLPGSGKTTLSQSICRHVAALQKSGSVNVEVVHICFDDVTRKHQKQIVNSVESSDAGRKESSPEGAFDPFLWKSGRQLALREAENLLTNERPSSGQRLLLLLDDTMHLRSMRRDVFQMARKLGTAFMIVSVSVNPIVSFERNNQRSQSEKVPLEVWESLSLREEVPDSTANLWEKPIIKVTMEGKSSIEETGAFVWGQIDNLWGPPIKQLPSPFVLEEMKLKSREKNERSLIHVIDKWSRTILSQTLGKSSQNHIHSVRECVGKDLNVSRRKMLQRIRDLPPGNLSLEDFSSFFISNGSFKSLNIEYDAFMNGTCETERMSCWYNPNSQSSLNLKAPFGDGWAECKEGGGNGVEFVRQEVELELQYFLKECEKAVTISRGMFELE